MINLPEPGVPLDTSFSRVNPTDQILLIGRQEKKLQSVERGFLESSVYSIAAPVVAAADTFLETFGILDENDMEEFLQRNAGAFGEFFQEHRGLVGAVGDIAGAFIPGMIAVKAVQQGSVLARLASKALGPGADKLFSTGLSNRKLFETHFQQVRNIAQKSDLSNMQMIPGFAKMRSRAIKRSVADVLIEGVAADAAIALTMNSSEFLFPEDMALTDHLYFFAGTNAVFGVAAGLVARNVFVRGVNDALKVTQRGGGLPVDEFVSNVANAHGPVLGALGELLERQNKILTEAMNTGDATARQTALAQLTATREQIRDVTLRLFQDSPFEGVTHSTRLNPKASGAWVQTVQEAVERDKSLAYNLRSLELWDTAEAVPIEKRVRAAIAAAESEVQSTQAEIRALEASFGRLGARTPAEHRKLNELHARLAKARERHDEMSRVVPGVVELDGTTRAFAGRLRMFQDGERRIAMDKFGHATVTTEKGALLTQKDGSVFVQDPNKLRFDIDPTTGEFLVGEGAAARALNDDAWLQLDHYSRTAVWDTLRKQAETATPESRTAQEALAGYKNMTREELQELPFWQLDYATELFTKMDFVPQSFRTIDELVFESLDKKFQMFQRIMGDEIDAMNAGVPAELLKYQGKAGLENLARELNLPTDNHALMRLFETQLLHDGESAVTLHTLAGNMEGLQQMLGVVDEFVDPSTAMHRVIGSLLELPGNRKPVIAVWGNNDKRAGVSIEDIMEQMGQLRAMQGHVFRTSESSYVRRMMQVIDDNPEAVQAAKTDMMSLVAGNEQDGGILRNILQQGFRFRNTPGAQAWDFITDIMDRMGDNQLARMLNPTKYGDSGINHQDRFNKLLARGSEADLASFMTAYHSLAKGWVVDSATPFVESTGKNGESLFQIKLANTPENQALWSREVGTEFKEGNDLMPSAGAPENAMTLTQTGVEVLESFTHLHDEILLAVNTDRRARGLKEIPRRMFHMPAPNLRAKHVAFLVDKTGNVRNVVGGNSERQLMERAEKEIAAGGGELSLISSGTMERYHAAKAEAFFGMVDYSATAAQTGPRTGKAVGATIDTDASGFKELLETTLKQFTDMNRQMRTTIFGPEIEYLKRMKAASGLKNADGTLAQTRTIYDEVISRIAGVQNLDASSVVGRHLLTAETTYDRLVQGVYDSITNTFPEITPSGNRAVKKKWEKIEDRFAPEHRPFRTVEEYMERNFVGGRPADLKRHGAALNEITTALSIRILDFGMGLINMASLAATLPPVVSMIRKMPDETMLQWQARTGAFGGITPEGHTYFSATKALTSAAHFMFTQEGRELAKKAARDGWFDQFAAEQVNIFGRTGEGFITGMIRNASDKLSFITDKTEQLARATSWMTFYKMGKDGLGLTENAAMAFAHRQANNVIADFRPLNRPAIFQGAAGVPLGLFSTYMWNFFQRTFHMVENQAWRTGAIQAGLQGSLFGAEALPGWGQFTDRFMSNYDGTHNIVDRLNESLGPMGADVFLNGTLANLPRLFGADDGISVGPRASAGIPFEQGIGARAVPGLGMLIKAGETAGKLIDSAIENQGVAPTQVAEILATSNMNKFMTNAIELGLGHAVDNMGGLIEQDTRTRIGIAARTLGFKPLMADEMRQESVRHRTTERIQQQLKQRLTDSLTSSMRNGRLSTNAVEKALESYVRAGGSGDNFRQFVGAQVLKAHLSKRDREMMEAVNRSIDENRIGRLLWLDR